MAARKKPELLIPASSLDVLKTAVTYGADAVYIGGEAFGLRAKAKNFSKEDMAEGIAFAHAHDVKVYVTANILAHNDDLDGVPGRSLYHALNIPLHQRPIAGFRGTHMDDHIQLLGAHGGTTGGFGGFLGYRRRV